MILVDRSDNDFKDTRALLRRDTNVLWSWQAWLSCLREASSGSYLLMYCSRLSGLTRSAYLQQGSQLISDIFYLMPYSDLLLLWLKIMRVANPGYVPVGLLDAAYRQDAFRFGL